MFSKLSLQTKIVLSMVLGFIVGFILIHFKLNTFTLNWIKPFGTLFINALKAIAIPLVFISLVKGISSLSDLSKLSRLSAKTISLYLFTTVISISFGLILANTFKPGNAFSEEKKISLKLEFGDSTQKKIDSADTKTRPPLQFIVDMVPDNVFKATTDNSKMLQVILVALVFGIAIVLLKKSEVTVLKNLISNLNAVLLKVIDIIMLYAPIGVFALIASLMVEFGGDSISEALDLFLALGAYSLTVLFGLFMMMFLIYPSLIKIFTKVKLTDYFKAVFPIQMVAFTTSSSAATLPVTMENCEKKLGISPEVSSFVLPVGATINMDGTALYQSVSVIFIAQVFGYDLDFSKQLSIILTATLASIGTAGVPGAGIVMLVIVLNSVGMSTEGIALIFAVERILDMFRTVVNVTGDTAVAVIVDASERRSS